MEATTFNQGLRRLMLAIGGAVLAVATLVAMLATGTPTARAAPGTTVSGQVTHSTGVPVGNVCVSLHDTTGDKWHWVAGATTRPDGSYDVEVDPGTYLIRFEDCGSGYDLVATNYGSGDDDTPQTTVTIGGLTGIDVVMVSGRPIRGTVSDVRGDPAAGVCVAIHPYDDVLADDWRSVGWATADEATGEWVSSPLAPGDYAVEYFNCAPDGSYIESGRWVAELHSDVYIDDHDPDWSSLRPVTVGTDADPAPISDDLLEAAQLKGVVRGDGTPAKGICVSGPGVRGEERTDGSGAWYASVRPGKHTFTFTDCLPGRGLAQESLVISVTDGGQLIHDVAMTARATASISGRVTNRAGVAITPACVVAFVPDQIVGAAEVAPTGKWSIQGLGAGTYILAVFNCDDPSRPMVDPVDGTRHPTTWWPSAPAALDRHPDPLRDGAVAVTLTPGAVATGYDFCLPGGCPQAKPTPKPTTKPTPKAAAAPSAPRPAAPSDRPPAASPGGRVGVDRRSTPRSGRGSDAGNGGAGEQAAPAGLRSGWDRSPGTERQSGVASSDLGDPVTAVVTPPANGEVWWKALAVGSALSTVALGIGLLRTRRRLLQSIDSR